MKTSALLLGLSLAACGGAASTAPVVSPTTTTSAATAPAEAHPAPGGDVQAQPAPGGDDAHAQPAPAPAPVEAAAEKCDEGWICVKVNLATGKVEKRETKLLGDPKIESTWSKQSDGRTATFDDFSKGPVELTLRRKPGNKNDVVVKLSKGGPTVVIDKHDGTTDDFTHVGAIATEQNGSLLVDLRYMR